MKNLRKRESPSINSGQRVVVSWFPTLLSAHHERLILGRLDFTMVGELKEGNASPPISKRDALTPVGPGKEIAMVYYHGTSSAVGIDFRLLPPAETGVIEEVGRKKNLDRVFFTADRRSADVYAGRAVQRFGGRPVVYRVIPQGEVVCMNDTPGTSVFSALGAFVEKVA